MAVTPEDVAENLGRPTPNSDTPLYKQWTRWIAGVRLSIKNRLGNLDALDQEALDYVVLETVSDRARPSNDGQTSTTVTLDDGSVTNRWDNTHGTRGFDFGDTWWGWAFLSPNASAEGYSTRPTFVSDRRIL